MDPFPPLSRVVCVGFSLRPKAPGTANERPQLIPQEFSSLKMDMVPNRVIPLTTDSPVAQMVKKSACNPGDLGLIPGLGIYPGEENSYPLQYSCLENPMDRGAWQATYSSWGHKELDTTEGLTLIYIYI